MYSVVSLFSLIIFFFRQQTRDDQLSVGRPKIHDSVENPASGARLQGLDGH